MQTQTAAVTWDDLKAWLAAHGAPTEGVRSISFVPEGLTRGGGSATVHLRVELYATDANGQRFAIRGESGHEVATEVTWVPLHQLP